MSFVNFISHWFCPDFKEFYLVNSSILREAMKRTNMQAHTITFVGELEEDCRFPDTSQVNYSRSKVVHITFDESGGEKAPATVHVPTDLPISAPAAANPLPQSPAGPGCTALEGRMDVCERSDTSAENYHTLHVPCSNPLMRYNHPLRRLWHRIAGTPLKEAPLPKLREPRRGFTWGTEDIVNILFLLSFNGAIIGIFGGISHFQPGQSTMAQRVWTMLWLATGFSLVIITLVGEYAKTKVRKGQVIEVAVTAIALTLIPPALGGFVVVGQMLRDYGTCTVLS
jgi:hypothetical protein